MNTWRILLLPLLLALAPSAWPDLGEPVSGPAAVVIPQTQDLQAEAAQASRERLPLLLMFSSDYCHYCTVLARDFLQPMIYTGDDRGRVLIRMVKLDAGRSLRDFDGRRIAATDLAARYGVRVTPTLLFVDDQGRQVAEKMVGLTTPDFYGAYLGNAIDTALQHVRSGTALACRERTATTC